MKYALVNGIKTEATKSGLRGVCQGCGSEMVAKCGEIKIHHWAHLSTDVCDFEREPETEWHREWKSYFKNQEVRQEKDGLVCIADALNSNGIAIEFQHSPIRTETIKKREQVHGKVIWVVDCIGKDVRHGETGVFSQKKQQENYIIDDAICKYVGSQVNLLTDEMYEKLNNVFNGFIQEKGYKTKGKIDIFDWETDYKIKRIALKMVEQLHSNELQSMREKKHSAKKIYRVNWLRHSAVWSEQKLKLFLQVDEDTLLYIRDNTQLPITDCTKITKQQFIDRYAV